jgi:hypothetical protein
MPVWRDPLDELIAALERVAPVGTATEQAFELPPPIEDYSVAVQAILSRDPVERARLAADPAVKRVDEYHERLARTWQSSHGVEPGI